MLKTMRKANIKGFSLIELMVVVAIIGILAAVAVPNFQRFQRKARQSEAKALLGGLYTAMEVFRGEYEDYLGEFVDIGFQPSGTLIYDVGFTAAGAVPTIPTWMDDPMGFGQITAMAACMVAVQSCTAGPTALAAGGTWTNVAMGGNDQFLAGASGEIGGTQRDDWEMDEVKLFTNIQDGTF